MLPPTIEVLLLIEHQEKISREALQEWRKSSLKGIIGKLEARNLIKTETTRRQKYYTLTKEGTAFIDDHLELLKKKPQPWNSQWTVVVFGIPERNRASRDRFRRYLQKEHFTHLYGSLWIAPGYKPQPVLKKAKELSITDRVVVMEGRGSQTLDQKIIGEGWQLTNLRKQYNSFIKRARALSSKKGSDDESRYEIKKLIFELTLILAEDPGLPENLLGTDWPRRQALVLYQTIRTKLY